MDRFNFYKELYLKEFERRDNLNKDIISMISLISVLLAGMFYLFVNFKYTESYFMTYFFNISVALFTVSMLISLCFLIKAYHNWFSGFSYKYLPYCVNMENYYFQINHSIEYEERYVNNNNDEELINQKIENEFQEGIIANYFITYTDDNSYQNLVKSENIHKTKTFLVISFCILLFSLFPFLYNFTNTNIH